MVLFRSGIVHALMYGIGSEYVGRQFLRLPAVFLWLRGTAHSGGSVRNQFPTAFGIEPSGTKYS